MYCSFIYEILWDPQNIVNQYGRFILTWYYLVMCSDNPSGYWTWESEASKLTHYILIFAPTPIN